MRKYTKILVVLVLLVTFAGDAFANPTELLPDPRDITPSNNDDDIYLEVSRVGTGNSLDAPTLQMKLYYNNPTGNQVHLIDGYFCDESYSAVVNNGRSADTRSDARTRFRVYAALNNSEEANTSNYTGPHQDTTYRTDAGCVGDTLVINVPNLSNSVTDQNRTDYKYVAILTAEQVGDPAGVNAFKVYAPGGQAVYSSQGIDPTINNLNRRTSSSNGNPVVAPISLQDRIASGDTDSNITLKFATPCIVPGSGTPPYADQNIYLNWFDDDQGGFQNDMRWELWERDRVGDPNQAARKVAEFTPSYNGTGGSGAFTYSPARSTGDGVEAQYRLNPGVIKDDFRYEWRWFNIPRNNGIQVYVPFDSYNYNVNCAANAIKVQGIKRIKQTSGSWSTGAPANNVGIRAIGTDGATQNTTNQPYTINNIVADGNNFYVGVPTIPSGTKLLGFTVCRNPNSSVKVFPYNFSGTPCNHGNLPIETAPAGQSMAAVVTFRDVPQNNGDFIDLWWHFCTDANNNNTCDSDEPRNDKIIVHMREANTCQARPALGAIEIIRYAFEWYRNPGGVPAYQTQSGLDQVFQAGINRNLIYRTDFSTAPDWEYTGYSISSNTSSASDSNCGVGFVSTTAGPIVNAGPLDNVDQYYHVYLYYENIVTDPGEKKIYGASSINITPSAARDNDRLDIDVNSFLWADATNRFRNTNGRSFNGQGLANYLWVAGVYGARSGDTGRITAPYNDPNLLSVYNLAAEAACPNGRACAHSVPLAYVDANDGSGIANTADVDNLSSPDGNNWFDIRQRRNLYNNNYRDGTKRVTDRYNSTTGGIGAYGAFAAQTDDGVFGNYINNVEISNIRVRANDLDVALSDNTLQGRLTNGNALQVAELNSGNFDASDAYLPRGSQGPRQIGVWDNIRNPSRSNSSQFRATTQRGDIEFGSTETGAASRFGAILLQPDAMLNNYNDTSREREIASVRAVSLLQDGTATYNDPTEPLSYTAQLDRVENTDLVWDEYVEWTQMDDKGHYYTTRATRPTGIDRGPSDRDSYYLDSVNRGSRQQTGCPDVNHNGRCDPGERQYTSCSYRTYRSGIRYYSNSRSYYSGSTQSRYGWLNTDVRSRSRISGTTYDSYFGSDPSRNPNWANTSTAFWQDTSITTMDNSGSSEVLSRANSWDYDLTDRAYTNRYIYDRVNTPSFYTGWGYRYARACVYPNGSVNRYYAGQTATHYQSANYLYETSTSVSGAVYGTYNFARDGVKDNVVDTGWAWRSNPQRTRYEHTWSGNQSPSRRLGKRISAREGGLRGAFGQSLNRSLLYGLDPTQDTAALASIRAARGTATIFSPVFDTANADIFSGAGLDSYFQNSTVGSAFIFTSDSGITNIDADRRFFFNNYFINENADAASKFFSGDTQNIRKVFTNYDSLVSGANTSRLASGSFSGTFPLNDTVYYHDGDLTLGTTRFTSGAGTIIVTGDLYINRDITYNDSNIITREDLPSAGFIVGGDVYVAPNVREVNGAYFVNNCFTIQSLLARAGNNCTTYSLTNSTTADDRRFLLRGLVIADRFALLRQPSGFALRANLSAETFRYDGRVVVNTPPGFSRIFAEDADYNELSPEN